jgi:hypothetical protein
MKTLLYAFGFTLICTCIGLGIGNLIDYTIAKWPDRAGSMLFVSFLFVMTAVNYYWMKKTQK